MKMLAVRPLDSIPGMAPSRQLIQSVSVDRVNRAVVLSQGVSPVSATKKASGITTIFKLYTGNQPAS